MGTVVVLYNRGDNREDLREYDADGFTTGGDDYFVYITKVGETVAAYGIKSIISIDIDKDKEAASA